MTDTRKSNFHVIFFNNFSNQTYKYFNSFYYWDFLFDHWYLYERLTCMVFYGQLIWRGGVNNGGFSRTGSNLARANVDIAIEMFYHGIASNSDDFLFSFSFTFLP